MRFSNLPPSTAGCIKTIIVPSSHEIQGDELRTAVRFPLRLPLSVKAGSGERRAETENISSGGVLFKMDAEMAVGSLLEFSISMPKEVLASEADLAVKCLGRVVRCQRTGKTREVAAIIDEYHFERS